MTSLAARVAELRAQGLSAFAISSVLNIDLSEVRRLEDPKAAAASERWNLETRQAAEEAERIFSLEDPA